MRFVPTAWSDVPATTATSSPGARQSCSSVCCDGVAVVVLPDAPSEPPPHEEARSAVANPTASAAASGRLTPSNVDERSRTAASGSTPARLSGIDHVAHERASAQSPSENVKLGRLN